MSGGATGAVPEGPLPEDGFRWGTALSDNSG